MHRLNGLPSWASCCGSLLRRGTAVSSSSIARRLPYFVFHVCIFSASPPLLSSLRQRIERVTCALGTARRQLPSPSPSPCLSRSPSAAAAAAMARSRAFPRLLLLLLASLLWRGSAGSGVSAARAKQVSWKPRAFVYEGFLTDEECDHLISLATLELKRSHVADSVSGESKLSEVRTSSGMFISKGKDPIVAGIEDKIAAWTFLPKENGEDIQVLRYEPGQKYDPHYDYFSDNVNIRRGGHRIATVLMYLTDVERGGETVFPSAEEFPRRGAPTKDDSLSDCARRGVAVKPKRGDTLLFFSLHPDATPDTSSLHAGCPVLEGEKWSATKWIHVDSFDKIVGDEDHCSDQNERCEKWAALGECTKNPEYMVGTADLPGYCRRSCKVC